MKKIQLKWLKAYNAVIFAVLSVLGFTMSSCSKCKYGSPIAEYGTPSATFVVQGKVTDSQTNQPIEGIQIEMSWSKTFTDADGQYQIATQHFPDDQTFPVRFRDIDGELNGSYLDLDTTAAFQDPKFTGGDGRWHKGEVI